MRPWLLSTRLLTMLKWAYSPGNNNMPTAVGLFIHELGGHFPNLETLYLSHLDWSAAKNSPSTRMFAAISAFASVQTLKLGPCKFPSFGAARCAITSLPSLADLTLNEVTWPIARGPEPFLRLLRSSQKTSLLQGIRRLRFWGEDATRSKQILQWLSTTALAASLVDLNVGPAAILGDASELWEYVGPSTTRLRMSYMQARDSELVIVNESTSYLKGAFELRSQHFTDGFPRGYRLSPLLHPTSVFGNVLVAGV